MQYQPFFVTAQEIPVNMNEKSTVVATYSWINEAEQAQFILQSNGIKTELTGNQETVQKL